MSSCPGLAGSRARTTLGHLSWLGPRAASCIALRARCRGRSPLRRPGDQNGAPVQLPSTTFDEPARQVKLDAVDIVDSAHKQGISGVSIVHAWENAFKIAEFEHDQQDRLFVIGRDRSGNLLELVAIPMAEPTRIVHADRLRPKFYDSL